MTFDAEAAAARPIRGARSWWMLGSLALGLIAGAGVASMGDGPREPLLRAAIIIGGLWLNALKMTVIPLIVALLVMGIAQGAEALRAGRVAARTMGWFVAVYLGSSVLGALMITAMLGAFPLPEAAVDAAAADSAIGGGGFIFDVQLHCVDPKAAWTRGAEGEQWRAALGQAFPQGSKIFRRPNSYFRPRARSAPNCGNNSRRRPPR